MTSATCPLCGGSATESTFPFSHNWLNRNFEFLRCADCRTACLSPVPTDRDFAQMYAKSEYHDAHQHEADSLRADDSLRWAAGLISGKRRMLDFGCGSGAFLRLANLAGFDASGVEFDEAARRAAAERSGSEVISLQSALNSNQRFDIIHLSDVLEHLPDPIVTLRQLVRLLKPDGLLFIEGPLERNPSLVYWSAASVKWVKRALGVDRPAQTPPYHLYMTDACAQLQFFRVRAGLEILAFAVHETGHPFSSAGDPLRSSIALASRALSRVFQGSNIFGNRFRAILRVPVDGKRGGACAG